MNDEELVALVLRHFRNEKVVKALLITRWKDGIDIQVPTTELREFVVEVIARGQ